MTVFPDALSLFWKANTNTSQPDEQMDAFAKALSELINIHGIDSKFSIPDYVLSEYLVSNILTLDTFCSMIDKHNGVE